MRTKNPRSRPRLETPQLGETASRKSAKTAPPMHSGGHATRQVILNTAVEFASMHGLEQLSLGKLASAVKMSKSGLFAHFESKAQLQLATINAAWDIFEDQVLRDPTGERGDGLAALIERWLSFSERVVFRGGCLFSHQAVEFATRSGPVSEALTAAVARQIQAIEERLPAAAKVGGGRQKDGRDLAFELHSIVIHADAMFRMQRDPIVFDRARAAIRNVCPAATQTANKRRARSSR